MGRPSYLFVLYLVLLAVSCSKDDDEQINQYPATMIPSEQAYKTGLPVVIINTPDSRPIESKEEWIPNVQVCIVVSEGNETFEGSAFVKGRGNVTWDRYPKKPYSLKLTKKAEILGMAASKRWVLLSNWADRTLLRNDVAFEIARRTSLAWTPRGKPVELILNGEYRGAYYLCEKVQINRNRLDIEEMDDDDNDVENITGGYLMEIDKYFDEANKFRSATYHLPYQFRNPGEDVLTDAQFNYMQQYVNDFEASLSSDPALQRGDYVQWIDPLSFIDWWIVNELCYNKEVSRPKSVYLHKQRGGRLTMGPVWDFDFSTFTPHDDIYAAERFPYLQRLFQNADFRQAAEQRWQDVRPKMMSIPDYIDQQAQLIQASALQNSLMWPISLKLNGDEQLSFDEAIERMKQSFLLRLSVVDRYFTEQQ